jgi:hypothetical protein
MNETWFKIVVKQEFFNNLSKIIGVHLHKIHNYESIVYFWFTYLVLILRLESCICDFSKNSK